MVNGNYLIKLSDCQKMISLQQLLMFCPFLNLVIVLHQLHRAMSLEQVLFNNYINFVTHDEVSLWIAIGCCKKLTFRAVAIRHSN